MDVFIGRTANQVIRAVASDFCDPEVEWRGYWSGPEEGKSRCHRQQRQDERQETGQQQKGKGRVRNTEDRVWQLTPVITAFRN